MKITIKSIPWFNDEIMMTQEMWDYLMKNKEEAFYQPLQSYISSMPVRIIKKHEAEILGGEIILGKKDINLHLTFESDPIKPAPIKQSFLLQGGIL